MSIAILTQVYDEVRRLGIAGSNLASDDFRLKKLVPPLEKAAAKAPVFGKVAEAIQKLADSPGQESAQSLLELSTLVSAILYTQGETGAEGEFQPIETTNLALPHSTASARVLKPLIEALTSTGSGRRELIADAYQRGAFQDLRLVRLALHAIDDGFSEIGDLVADHILPVYGKAIYGDLKSSFDPKGKGGQVRRLRLMQRLDPESTRELVDQALESGSKEMKVAAIECLEGSPDALPYLLEQAKARSADVRRAALGSLANFTDDAVVDVVIKALSGSDLALAAQAVSQNRSPKLLNYLLEEANKLLDQLLALPKKEKGKLPARFLDLLACFDSRSDDLSIAFLTRCFEGRNEIAKIKGEPGGQEINRKVVLSLVRANSQTAQRRLVDARESLAADLLDCAVLAAVRSRPAREVYDLFSPYYLAQLDAKMKQRDPAWQKRESVRNVLMQMSPHRSDPRNYRRINMFTADLGDLVEDAELDVRWLDAAVRAGDLEVVEALARADHAGCHQFLSNAVEAMLKKKGDDEVNLANVLDTMNRAQHPDLVDYYLRAIKKVAGSRRGYYMYWLARLIPELPPTAADKIQDALPTLPEKIVDQLAPYLTELRSKSP